MTYWQHGFLDRWFNDLRLSFWRITDFLQRMTQRGWPFSICRYKRCSKWNPLASRFILALWTAAWITLVFETAARAFSICALWAGSVVGFRWYMTSSRVSRIRWRHLPLSKRCHGLSQADFWAWIWSWYGSSGTCSLAAEGKEGERRGRRGGRWGRGMAPPYAPE